MVVELHSTKSENHPNSALISDDSPRLTNFSSELGSDGRTAKSVVAFSCSKCKTGISEVVIIVVVAGDAVSDAIVFVFVFVLLLVHDVGVIVRWLC